MPYNAFVYNSWVGGQAIDKKIGNTNSFANSQAADFRKSPSQWSVLPGTRRTDGGVVTDLIQNEVMIQTGEIYALGSSGNVYRVTAAGVWSLFGNIGQPGTFGLSYRQDQDAIYIAGTTTVSSITTVSTAPRLNAGYYDESQSTYNNSTQADFNVNSNQTGGGQTTAILTSYIEDDPKQLRYFQTDIQPISKIGVNITAKGTGNWTLTVHDGLNNLLGSVVVTNANIINGQVNYFVFTTPIQANVGPNAAQTYHFHITSTVADGTVASTTMNDLSTCDMELWANRLVATTNGIHTITTFQQFECIGNGRYLSVWENLGEQAPSNAAWQRQKLSFPPGYEECGTTVFNEYLVIATQRTTTGTNTPQEGILFYWDGLSDTYNYFTPIPEGSPQGIKVHDNAIHYTASGDRYVITSVAATPEKYRKLPSAEGVFTTDNAQTQVYPYTATVRNGILLFAWPSTTNNTSLPYGIYSWGRVDNTKPYSFGYSYILSTGSQFKTVSNNLTIGMVKNFGSVLHISWRDGSTYGVDVVDANSTPASFSKIESLIVDNGMVTKDKQASYVEACWNTIQNGVSIVLKYSINRGDWIYSSGATSNAAGGFSNANLYAPDGKPGYGRLDIGTGGIEERYNELQIGMDVYCDSTVTTTPEIIGLSAPFDPLAREELQ